MIDKEVECGREAKSKAKGPPWTSYLIFVYKRPFGQKLTYLITIYFQPALLIRVKLYLIINYKRILIIPGIYSFYGVTQNSIIWCNS